MKRLVRVSVVLGLAIGLGACSTISEPDRIGLYYMEGPIDGYKFGECIDPGKTGPFEWDNSVVYLPTNLRTWTIDSNQPGQAAPGADSGDEIVVSAKPEKEQPSGVQVKIATKTNFYLNTFCDDKGGIIRDFWEKIGRRYKADSDEGWRNMLNAELVPVQKTIIKDVIRGYSADPLIANENGVQGEAQKTIAERLASEFNRIAGGQFFCGPSFNRLKSECPPLELLIIGVEYADPGIQAARNEKQKAIELAAAQLARAQGEAAALVAEAVGKRDAAAAIANLYNTPGWVALQKQIEASRALVEACKAAKECRLVVGPDGTVIMA